MLKKTLAIAALAGATALAATPALADKGRHDRFDRHDRGGKRVVVVHKRAPYYAPRRVVVHRPVVVRHSPTVVYRSASSHDVLGGLIVGAVLGAVIASHGGY
ncbi:MAG: hypothetical protein AB7S87_13560 [Burkholderiales bacterium]